jgi:hypothetical protein
MQAKLRYFSEVTYPSFSGNGISLELTNTPRKHGKYGVFREEAIAWNPCGKVNY